MQCNLQWEESQLHRGEGLVTIKGFKIRPLEENRMGELTTPCFSLSLLADGAGIMRSRCNPSLSVQKPPQTSDALSSCAASSKEPALMAILQSSDDITLSRWSVSFSFCPGSVRFLRPGYKNTRNTFVLDVDWMSLSGWKYSFSPLAGNIPSLGAWHLPHSYNFFSHSTLDYNFCTC